METAYLPFLFIFSFIPTRSLTDRGLEKHSFHDSILMSSGHEFYTPFAIQLRGPS